MMDQETIRQEEVTTLPVETMLADTEAMLEDFAEDYRRMAE